MADIFCCHLRPFFALLPHYWTRKLKFGKNVKNTLKYYSFTHVYPKWRSYNVSFLRYKMQSNLTLLNTRKMKILKKMKKMHGDIILHLWTIHDYHMMYVYWDIECGKQNFLSFLAIFQSFTTLAVQKIKILKKWKKTPWDFIISHISTVN